MHVPHGTVALSYQPLTPLLPAGYHPRMLRSRRLTALFSPLCAALCLVFLVPTPAQSIPTPDVHHRKRDYKHEVEGMEEQWRQAQLTDDVGAMDRLLSDDYVGISMNGEVTTKAQQLDRLRSRSLVLTKIERSDVKVKILGKVAIVTSLASVEGMDDGLSITGLYRYTRVYQRLPAGIWKITNFELTRVPPRGHAHSDATASTTHPDH